MTTHYQTLCSKNGVDPDIVEIPNTNIQAFWVGNKDVAKYAMLFIHGGGYGVPGSYDHLDFVDRLTKWSNGRLTVLVVDYTLSTNAPYPRPIGECVESLRYILTLLQFSPATTLIGGDSAGASLSLAVISHISGHPHPQSTIIEPLELSEPLKGALIISPWVSMDRKKYVSWDVRADRDVFPPNVAEAFAKNYQKTAPDDEYIYAALADPSWWHHSKAGSMLVTAGEHETLKDAITDFVMKYRSGTNSKSIKFIVGERESHGAPLLSLGDQEMSRLGEKCQEATVRLWIQRLD